MEFLIALDLPTYNLMLYARGALALLSAFANRSSKKLPISSRYAEDRVRGRGSIDKKLGWIIIETRTRRTAYLGLTPSWAQAVFGNLKTWLRGAYNGVSPKHLQRYLNEFQFRFNKRWHEADLFSPVLHAAIVADPFPHRHLTAERTG